MIIFLDENLNQKELDAKTVKSPGAFDNVAPESKNIITPAYAAPKVDFDIKVSTLGVAQRSVPLGVTTLVKEGRAFDPRNGTFNTVGFVENKQIVGLTTAVRIIFKNNLFF